MAKSKKSAPKKAAKKAAKKGSGTVVFNNGVLQATGKVAKSLSEHPRNHGAFTKGSREKVSADYYARQRAINEARPGIQLAVKELIDSLGIEDRKYLLAGLKEVLISKTPTSNEDVVRNQHELSDMLSGSDKLLKERPTLNNVIIDINGHHLPELYNGLEECNKHIQEIAGALGVKLPTTGIEMPTAEDGERVCVLQELHHMTTSIQRSFALLKTNIMHLKNLRDGI